MKPDNLITIVIQKISGVLFSMQTFTIFLAFLGNIAHYYVSPLVLKEDNSD